jgi:hypothetical protein
MLKKPNPAKPEKRLKLKPPVKRGAYKLDEPVEDHRATFERLLDDAIGVKKKDG